MSTDLHPQRATTGFPVYCRMQNRWGTYADKIHFLSADDSAVIARWNQVTGRSDATIAEAQAAGRIRSYRFGKAKQTIGALS